MKIKNLRHYDTADEIITELLDKIQKLSGKAEDIFKSDKTSESRLASLERMETECAALSNFLDNDLGYSVRTDDGMLFTQVCFNRIFYFRQMAAVEASKKKKQEAGE